MTRLIGVVRVSSEGQSSDGYGIELQVAAIKEWARKQADVEVEMWAIDVASGTESGLSKRKEFAAALGLIDAGKADGIVVWRLDRLARDMVVQELLLRDIVRAGGIARSVDPQEDLLCDPSMDDAEPARRLIRRILGAVAEYERMVMQMRMAAGRAAKVASGGTLGPIPRGFRIGENGRPVVDEREYRILAELWTLSDHGCPYPDLCEFLRLEAFPMRNGSIAWTANGVKLMLRRMREKQNITPRPVDDLSRNALRFLPVDYMSKVAR